MLTGTESHSRKWKTYTRSAQPEALVFILLLPSSLLSHPRSTHFKLITSFLGFPGSLRILSYSTHTTMKSTGLGSMGPISLPNGELSKGRAGLFCHLCVFRAPHANRAEKAVQSCIIEKLSTESLGRILGADTSRKDPRILWGEPGKSRQRSFCRG